MKMAAIILTTENNSGIWGISALMISILENTKVEYRIKFYILLDRQLDEKEFQIMKEIRRLYSNFDVEYINITTYIKTMDFSISGDEFEGYWRILCPVLLPEETKCLCFGNNIIVKRDLSYLYNIELQDNYIAGVRSIEASWKNSYNMELEQLLNLKDLDHYVYADVLIMNLKKMREDNFVKRSLLLIRKQFPGGFQDVMNSLCGEKILHLPLQYNVSNHYFGVIESWSTEIYSENEIYYADQFPVIIRYISGTPWLTLKEKASKTWWHYAYKLSNIDIVGEKYSLADMHSAEYSKTNLKKKCLKYSNIVIFGYTKMAINLCQYLLDNGIINIRCFCDNSLEKQGKNYRGILVEPALKILDWYGQVLVINVSQRFYRTIDDQLQRMGVALNSIYHYREKRDIKYYMALDEDFYDETLYEIKQDEAGRIEILQNMDIEEMKSWLRKAQDESARYLVDKYWMKNWLLL